MHCSVTSALSGSTRRRPATASRSRRTATCSRSSGGHRGRLIQSVRSWSVAQLGRGAGQRGALPRLLPGSLRYPLLGPLAETAEIAAVSVLGRRQGFAPPNWYASVLARNAGHFAPFS